MLDIRLIYSQDFSGGIGNRNEIPWHIKKDMQHFKEKTENSVVVMGRRTWESLPEKFRPLPNRTNVVVSSTLKKKNLPSGVKLISVSDIHKSLQLMYLDTGMTIWIIGGERLYKEMLPYASVIERTLVYGMYHCDTFAPTLDMNQWRVIKKEKLVEGSHTFEFETLRSFCLER